MMSWLRGVDKEASHLLIVTRIEFRMAADIVTVPADASCTHGICFNKSEVIAIQSIFEGRHRSEAKSSFGHG